MYNNYTIIKEKDLEDIKTHGVLLKHNKTNAKVLLLQNDDENKTFCIGFRTPPKDSTGVPHIIEHSVLCGSKKYPVKEPFVELMKSSLNTFLNAMTFYDKTIYPVSSCNDKDFQNLVDIYLDAVFYPNILTKKEIFLQEGWHYEYNKETDELTYNGVVYNEMKGAFSSSDDILDRQSLNSLFPDTAYGVESGGDPKDIPSLTYENFVKFYKKYYHPSNSYIILYGNCDMDEKLSYIDKEYLSNFDAINPDSDITIQKPFKETKYARFDYPVTSEQGVSKKALMSYNIALPSNLTLEEQYALDTITTVILQSNGAPLQKALLDSKIGSVVEGRYDTEMLQTMFSVILKNSDEVDKEKFEKIINDELNNLVKNGLDKKTLEGAINMAEFKAREADFGGLSKGLIYAISSFRKWLYDDVLGYESLEFGEVFKFLKEKINTNYYEELIKKYLIDNPHKSVVVVAPSLTFQDEKEKELKEKLAKIKEAMTKDELNEIILETEKLKKYQATPDSKEALSTIPLLKKEDLTTDVTKLSNIIKDVNGIKIIDHDYNTNKICYVSLLFDISKFKTDDLFYLSILALLLGKVDTKSYSFEELDQEININTGGIIASIFLKEVNKKPITYLSVNFSSLYNNLDKTYSLVEEIILSSKFDNKDKVYELLSKAIQDKMQSFIYGGNRAAIARAFSYIRPSQYILELTSGIEYYHKLNDLVSNLDNEYSNLVSKLEELVNLVFVKENMIASVTCDQEGFSYSDKLVSKLSEKLKESNDLVPSFEFIPNILNEGFKAPLDVNYCALVGDIEYKPEAWVLSNIIGTEYLWTQVRVLGGAYGCFMNISKELGFYASSYRDPNIANTYEVYKNIIKFLEDFNPSEEEFLKYIIGAVGTVSSPRSPRDLGATSLMCYFDGTTQEQIKKNRMSIINCNLDTIKSFIEPLKKVMSQNIICTIGNEKIVEENKALFKETKNLFK